MGNDRRTDLNQMAERIARMEQLALELRDMGGGAPVVEKNIRSILAAVYVLKFGITDVAETETPVG